MDELTQKINKKYSNKGIIPLKISPHLSQLIKPLNLGLESPKPLHAVDPSVVIGGRVGKHEQHPVVRGVGDPCRIKRDQCTCHIGDGAPPPTRMQG